MSHRRTMILSLLIVCSVMQVRAQVQLAISERFYAAFVKYGHKKIIESYTYPDSIAQVIRLNPKREIDFYSDKIYTTQSKYRNSDKDIRYIMGRLEYSSEKELKQHYAVMDSLHHLRDTVVRFMLAGEHVASNLPNTVYRIDTAGRITYRLVYSGLMAPGRMGHDSIVYQYDGLRWTGSILYRGIPPDYDTSRPHRPQWIEVQYYTYDSMGQITRIDVSGSHSDGSAPYHRRDEYTYDSDGLPSTWTRYLPETSGVWTKTSAVRWRYE